MNVLEYNGALAFAHLFSFSCLFHYTEFTPGKWKMAVPYTRGDQEKLVMFHKEKPVCNGLMTNGDFSVFKLFEVTDAPITPVVA